MKPSPSTGARFRAAHQICALAFLLPVSALACPYPDDGAASLERALRSVQTLPETQAWQSEKRKTGEPVQFRLLLEKEAWFDRKCYWTVEALAKNELWRRFYVSPDGKNVLIDYATSQPAEEPPRAMRRPAAKAAKP
jgi:hypothetical protein